MDALLMTTSVKHDSESSLSFQGRVTGVFFYILINALESPRGASWAQNGVHCVEYGGCDDHPSQIRALSQPGEGKTAWEKVLHTPFK